MSVAALVLGSALVTWLLTVFARATKQ